MEKAKQNPMKDPGCAPGIDDMIRTIERKADEGGAPKAVAAQVRVLKEGAWGPLNSFALGYPCVRPRSVTKALGIP